ncbi:hypothetical protein PPL_07310 [Heterostelium album PN500]|uniref:EGF-like domain-containing protein n=1 Tax=Heterostelium pallidum (strain ATCC 26659 / Pp 5 / PN500) TaxID=670386 RepID=D3BEZ4_HETP5|nr:hypothetical protein PPL_07310 [Heterostelium album PN500]EFA80475.1 hypothetical protein PPL_07310 [Heterostelium album PN500]|eukprot:XP_020432595.1 hypothetical protein PPL_07310 [Heterostelium album PN500]
MTGYKILFLLFVFTIHLSSSKKIAISSSSSNDLITCTINTQLSQCVVENATSLSCPKIVYCIENFNSYSKEFSKFEILIPSGDYTDTACPSVLPSNALQISGTLSFTSINSVTFNCSNQFISLQIETPIDLIFNGITFISCQTLGNGGCIEIVTERYDTSVILNDVHSKVCSANETGGFLYSEANYNEIRNSVLNGGFSTGSGGSIYALNGVVNISNSDFNFNEAGVNGGVVDANKIYVYNSLFSNNYAYQDGGALRSNQFLYVQHSIFANNDAADNGGAIAVIEKSYISNTIFSGNNAQIGGAIFSLNQIITENSQFLNNSALNGGAIYKYSLDRPNSSGLIVVDSSFTGNLAEFGGGLGFGGAINAGLGSIYIRSTEFNSNSGYNGGAIYVANGNIPQEIIITNSNFYNNFAHGDGGAISVVQKYNQSVFINLNQSSFWYNSAKNIAGGLFFQTPPDSLKGGLFIDSKSSMEQSYTFNYEAIYSYNIVNVTNPIPSYYYTIFQENTTDVAKVLGVTGECYNGIATINERGQVLSCKCNMGGSGPTCN